MSGARRLEAVPRAAGGGASRPRPAFGFELWDGSTVPGDLPPYAMRIVIGSESVVARLIRRPTADTLINAHVAGLIDLKNGTIFDLAEQRPQGKIGRRLRAVGKIKSLKTALAFLAGARGHAAAPRPGQQEPVARRHARRPTSRTSPITTTSRTPSTGSSSIRRWSIPAPTFSPTGTTISPARSTTSST